MRITNENLVLMAEEEAQETEATTVAPEEEEGDISAGTDHVMGAITEKIPTIIGAVVVVGLVIAVIVSGIVNKVKGKKSCSCGSCNACGMGCGSSEKSEKTEEPEEKTDEQ